MSTATMPAEIREHLGPNAEQTWLLFDSMLPAGQQWFTPKDLAALVQVNERTIRNAFNNPDATKRIFGFSFNFGGSSDWDRKLFPRWAIALALIKRANFDINLLKSLLDDLAESLSDAALEYLVTTARTRRPGVFRK